MVEEKVILAYSGGLNASVAHYMVKDYDVIAVCLGCGERKRFGVHP